LGQAAFLRLAVNLPLLRQKYFSLRGENPMRPAVVSPGQRYGRLTVLSRAENKGTQTAFLCRCDCGAEKVVLSMYLRSGRTASCGCAQGKTPRDLTGQRFGILTAIAPTVQRKGSRVVWECRCDCGGTVFRAVNHLLQSGERANCGCLEREIGQEAIKAITFAEGTIVDKLKPGLMYANNTSGVRGVFFCQTTQKWVAQIKFQSKLTRLGSFDTLDEARKARERAEEEIFQPFLEYWDRRQAAADGM